MTAYRSLGYEIAKLHKALRSHLQELLLPYDITVQQFEALRILKTDAGITATQLVERMMSDSSTIMSILKRLESKALIMRRPAENDRRTKLIFLTEKGRNMMAKLAVLADQRNKRIQACCSDEEWQVLENILSKLHNFCRSERER
ncbi:MAG: MarR family transcriptional regulator [Desulfobacteraceae bacterium]